MPEQKKQKSLLRTGKISSSSFLDVSFKAALDDRIIFKSSRPENANNLVFNWLANDLHCDLTFLHHCVIFHVHWNVAVSNLFPIVPSHFPISKFLRIFQTDTISFQVISVALYIKVLVAAARLTEGSWIPVFYKEPVFYNPVTRHFDTSWLVFFCILVTRNIWQKFVNYSRDNDLESVLGAYSGI